MRSIFTLPYSLLRLLTWPVRYLVWALRRPSAAWVTLEIRGKLEEISEPVSRWRRLVTRGARLSVLDVRRLCLRLVADPSIAGVLVRLEQIDASYPVLESLHGELGRLRAAGKRLIVHLPLAADERALYLASCADRVISMPHAGFQVLGPLAARTYFAALLRRLGVAFVVTAEGAFKTAAEPLVAEHMSQPEREQLGLIVDTLFRTWREAVARRLPGGASDVDGLYQLGLFGAARARELGLVDALAYDDELPGELAPRASTMDHHGYLRRSGPRPCAWTPLKRASQIAVVRLVGTIGEEGQTIGIRRRAVTELLRRVAAAPNIVGVILFIDSRGGSALVSELLHREIRRLDAVKPVVAWLGTVAASGGYYLACGARTIVASQTTLTGSIGVISLRPVLAELYQRLGLRREVVHVTPHADLYALERQPTDHECRQWRGETERLYARFLEVVCEGRGLPAETVLSLAGGRVWPGAEAHQRGLVDELGGYETALACLLSQLPKATMALEPLILGPKLRAAPAPIPASPASALMRAQRECAELVELTAHGELQLALALLPAS